MVSITQKELNFVLFDATEKTYLQAIIEKTPGKGVAADHWEIRVDSDSIVIFNEEFGDIILFLEEGTDAHIIKAKPGKFLRFKKPKTPPKKGKKIKGNIAFEKDGYIFTQQVNHPGIEARHFVKKIIEDSQLDKEWNRLVSEGIEKLLLKKFPHLKP